MILGSIDPYGEQIVIEISKRGIEIEISKRGIEYVAEANCYM